MNIGSSPNVPAHGAGMRTGIPLDVATQAVQAHQQGKATTLDRLLMPGPGAAPSFAFPGGVHGLAGALNQRSVNHVLITAGTVNAEGQPVTTGLPGAALLGTALRETGAVVSFALHRACISPFKKGLEVLNPTLARYGRIQQFPRGDDPAEAARGLLLETGVKAVVSVGTPDDSVLAEFLRAASELKANGSEIFSGAIGTSERQAGVVPKQIILRILKEIFPDAQAEELASLAAQMARRDDGSVASPIYSDHPVTAVPDLGAGAVAADVLAREDKLSTLPPQRIVRRLISEQMRAGAVDSMTGQSRPGASSGNLRAGVEGNSPGYMAAQIAEGIRRLVSEMTPAHPVGKWLYPVQAYGALDSSHGALIGNEEVLKFLLERFPIKGYFTLYGTDHGKAEYGDKRPEELDVFIRNIAATFVALLTKKFASICNTAATREKTALFGLDAEMINILLATANGIADRLAGTPSHKGDLIMIGTPVTAANMEAYPRLVEDETKGTLSPVMIGAPNWARIINKEQHASQNEHDLAYVIADIDQVLDQALARASEHGRTAEDIREVTLVCTHYGEAKFAALVHERMQLKGMTNAALVYPMGDLAELIGRTMLKDAQQQVREGIVRDIKPGAVAMTSGRNHVDSVAVLARRIHGDDTPVFYVDFHNNPQLRQVAEALKKYGLNIPDTPR